MARPLQQLTVFVSRPSDLGAEGKVIAAAMAELNQLFEKAYGVTFRVITAAELVPGVGPDPQAVINSQLQDYDMYLGVIGARFGTPTPRAGSGTEDEFLQAYERYRRDPSAIRLLFYFKREVDLETVDLEQLAKVREFRDRISSAGVFFAQFRNEDELLKLVKENLTDLLASYWEGNRWKVATPITPSVGTLDTKPAALGSSSLQPESEVVLEEETPGILDLVVEGTAALDAAVSALEKTTDVQGRATQKIQQKVVELSATKDVRAKQLIVNTLASDVSSFAQELRREVSVFNSSSSSGFDAFDRATAFLLVSNPADKSELTGLYSSLNTLESNMRVGRTSQIELRDAVLSTPKLTREFTKSASSLVAVLDEFIAGITVGLDKVLATKAKLEKYLGPDDGLPGKG